MSRRNTTVVALAVGAALGSAGLVGCSSPSTFSTGSSTNGSINGTGTSTGTSEPSSNGGGNAGGGDSGSGGNAGGSGGGGGGASGPTPTITSFKTPENIDCHNGNSQTFSASWTTTNAAKTTISIDGSGVYKTYGPNADESLPFNCSSPHTFLLTAFGSGGKTVTKSITLQPRNVQPPQTTEPSNPPGPSTTKASVPKGTVPSGGNNAP